MGCKGFFRQSHRVKKRITQCRSTNTYRIAERNLIASHIEKCLGYLVDELRVDFALVWAAHHARDVAAHLDVIFFCDLHHLLEALKALLYRAVDIFARECLASSTKDSDLIHIRGEGTLHASQIRTKDWVANPIDTTYASKHLGSIGQLWHGLW